jgi:hypothetical protein
LEETSVTVRESMSGRVSESVMAKESGSEWGMDSA